jgi:hypothetical protein
MGVDQFLHRNQQRGTSNESIQDKEGTLATTVQGALSIP